ncbi:MAG TPA: universal stress protein [Gaiella sp.]|nr:universal stress protein [Gaiella sp.]
MKNPVRDEASAFQVVLLTLGGAVLVVLAAWIADWLGVIVFLVLVAAALWAIRGGMRQRPPQAHVVRDAAEPARRILVVANETVGGEELRDLLGRKAAGVREDVLLVCPALNSKLRTWTSDEDGARAAAQARLDTSLERLEELGVRARGEIGDGDPLQALEDALREFPADEIVVSTHPPGRSHWLEQGVVETARMRYDVPVTHVVVDLSARAGSLRDPPRRAARD